MCIQDHNRKRGILRESSKAQHLSFDPEKGLSLEKAAGSRWLELILHRAFIHSQKLSGMYLWIVDSLIGLLDRPTFLRRSLFTMI